MRAVAGRYTAAGVAVLVLLPALARAQSSTVRGSVVDEQGRPIPDVQVEMEFLGDSRQKVVKKMTTDKKGVYLRAGVTSGRWRITFAKEGFKTRGMESDFSSGLLSEVPPVTLPAAAQAAPAAPAATGSAPAPEAPPSGASADVAATYAKAVAAFTAGQDAEAEALFKQVIEKAPGAGPAHYSLGLLAMKRKDLPAAETEFRKDIELRPQEPRAYIALATLLGASRRPDEALALLQGVAGSFGENAAFQFTLGVAAMNAGRDAEARPVFERCAQLDPSNAEAQYYLGTLAMGRDEIPAATSHLQKYLELAPEGPNAGVATKLLEALKTRK